MNMRRRRATPGGSDVPAVVHRCAIEEVRMPNDYLLDDQAMTIEQYRRTEGR